MTIRRPAASLASFFGVALAVCGIELAVARSAAFAARPEVLSAAVVIDVAILLPALYFLLVVRRGAAAGVTLWPVAVGAWLAARAILPAGHRQPLEWLAALAPAVEAVLVAWAVIRVRRIVREARAAGRRGADALGRLRAGLAAGLGDGVPARVLADELAVWHYALLARRPAPVPDGAAAFGYRSGSGWGAILVALVLVTTAETVAVHLVVGLWSTTAAWVLTALSGYGLLWLLADWRAMRLRPLVLDGRTLHVRVGLRWTVEVPLHGLAGVTRARLAPASGTQGYLRATPVGEPSLVLELDEAVTAEGLYGMRRQVRRIGIAVDDPAAFAAALEERTRAYRRFAPTAPDDPSA